MQNEQQFSYEDILSFVTRRNLLENMSCALQSESSVVEILPPVAAAIDAAQALAMFAQVLSSSSNGNHDIIGDRNRLSAEQVRRQIQHLLRQYHAVRVDKMLDYGADACLHTSDLRSALTPAEIEAATAISAAGAAMAATVLDLGTTLGEDAGLLANMPDAHAVSAAGVLERSMDASVVRSERDASLERISVPQGYSVTLSALVRSGIEQGAVTGIVN